MLFQIFFIIISLFLLFWQFSLVLSAFSGSPTVYAKNEAIRKAFLMAKLKPDEIVLDLGCGNATSLIIASREFGAKGIGVEISPYYYLVARLNVLLHGQSRSIKLYFGKIEGSDYLIRQANVVFLYLHDGLLKRIEQLIFQNIMKTTRVASLTYKFKVHKPKLTNKKPNIFIYKI